MDYQRLVVGFAVVAESLRFARLSTSAWYSPILLVNGYGGSFSEVKAVGT